jgi:flagellar motor switch protein FliG
MNIRKAAVLLTALPKEMAASVLRRLEQQQVEQVGIEIAQLGSVTGSEQEQVILEFTDENPNNLATTAGLDLAQQLVKEALGDDAAGALDNLRQSIAAVPFGFLRNVDPSLVLDFLMDEHPQTIALILSHLPPAIGAEILTGLPADAQLAVVQRVATMGQTSPEVIHQVEAGLESRMKSLMSQSFENAGGTPAVAEILNVTDRSTERSILDALSEEEPVLVEEIRRLMFVFEDVTKLTDKDIQTLLRNVERPQWAMSLKGASSELKEKVLGNMSKRAAQLLVEEMEFLGAVRLSDVEGVQQQIVDAVRSLEESGDIQPGHQSGNESGDEFVT